MVFRCCFFRLDANYDTMWHVREHELEKIFSKFQLAAASLSVVSALTASVTEFASVLDYLTLFVRFNAQHSIRTFFQSITMFVFRTNIRLVKPMTISKL